MKGETRDQVVALYELLVAQYLGIELEEAAALDVGELVDEVGTLFPALAPGRRPRRFRFYMPMSGSRFVALLCERRGIELPPFSLYDWESRR